MRGDIRFGRDVHLQGVVDMINASGAQAVVPDGSVIEGEWRA